MDTTFKSRTWRAGPVLNALCAVLAPGRRWAGRRPFDAVARVTCPTQIARETMNNTAAWKRDSRCSCTEMGERPSVTHGRSPRGLINIDLTHTASSLEACGGRRAGQSEVTLTTGARAPVVRCRCCCCWCSEACGCWQEVVVSSIHHGGVRFHSSIHDSSVTSHSEPQRVRA